jgi:hypothetical protein
MPQSESHSSFPRALAAIGVAGLFWANACQPSATQAEPAASPAVYTDEAGDSTPRASDDSPVESAAADKNAAVPAAHDDALNRAAPPRHVEDPQRGPLPLPEGATVLHVGDSFAGALGVPLNKRLREAKVRSILKFRTASYIVDWAHREPLRDYLLQYNPDLVLVTLGANELQIEAPERRIPAIEKIVQTIGDRPCIWIGIPLWEGANNGLPEIIEKHAAPCRYLDTDTLFPDMPRARDKIHPTMEAREDWASKVTHWLAQERRPTPDKIWALATP